MTKGKFVKRKNGSVDGILPTVIHQQESDIDQRQYTEELEHVSKKLEEVTKREAVEADRNISLEAEILELTSKKSGFEKVLMAQEEMIKNLETRVKQYEGKYISLNATLAESEVLNKEMTRKLQQYCDQKTQLMEEKEQLCNENNKWKNRLDMEKSKFELLKQKKEADCDETKYINDSLKKELIDSKNQLIKTKSLLQKRETELKTLSEELQIKMEVMSSRLHLSTVSQSPSNELATKLKQQTEKCTQLEKELELLKTSQRDSGMRLLSSDQSLEQLQSQLHRKSAESSALLIGKNTIQNKLDSLENENKNLEERLTLFEASEVKLHEEIILREETQHQNKQLVTDLMSSQNKEEQLAELNDENTKTITILRDEVANLLKQINKQETTISQLRKQCETLQNDCTSWKKSYTETHNMLLQVEYEKSDAAKIDLQKENALLKTEISKLRKEFSGFLEDVYEEKIVHKNRFDKTLKHLQQEKHELDEMKKVLQFNLSMANTAIEQKEKLLSSKNVDNKRANRTIEELQTRILGLEEKLREVERENFEKEHRIQFTERENREIQTNLDRLNSDMLYSPKYRLCQCRKNTKTGLHNRSVSAGSYYDANTLYSISNLRIEKFERKQGDGGPLSPCEPDTKLLKSNIT